MADASRDGGGDVPRAAMSPTSPAMAPSDVRVTVDGYEFASELVTEGVPVTENDVITRLGQQSETLRHVSFLFANTEDRVKMHLIQKQGEQEHLRKQLADVTAEREAARTDGGQTAGQVKEANRERDVAQSAEFEARTAAVNKSKEIQRLNDELHTLRRELSLMVEVNNVKEDELTLKHRRVTMTLQQATVLVNELETQSNAITDAGIRAAVGSKVDEVRVNISQIKKMIEDELKPASESNQKDKGSSVMGHAPLPGWVGKRPANPPGQSSTDFLAAEPASPPEASTASKAGFKAPPPHLDRGSRGRSTSRGNKIEVKGSAGESAKVDIEPSPGDPPSVPSRDPPTFGGSGLTPAAPEANPSPAGPPEVKAPATPPMAGLSDHARRNLDEVLDTIRQMRYPRFVTPDRDTHPNGAESPLYDPNFTVPPKARWLEQRVRDMWREYHSVWIGQPDRRLLMDQRLHEVTDAECNEFDAFDRLYGDMYRLMPLLFLQGPRLWLNNLSEYRRTKHLNWVKTISFLQSLLNVNYRPPVDLREIHTDFFNGNQVPRSTAYIKRLPEMQEKELLEMLLTWFGLLWVGNPFILGVKILYDDTDNNGYIGSGTAALRFATEELSTQFIQMFNGLEVYYEQYKPPELMSQEEKRSPHDVPDLMWFQTVISCEDSHDTRCLPYGKTRFPLTNPPIRYRDKFRMEALMWQCHIPSYDFDLWAMDSKWLVNPNSGNHLVNMRKHNRAFQSYLQHPDVSFWDAVGHHEGSSNGRRLWPGAPRVGGVWASREEYDRAWNDDRYCDADDAVNQRPIMHTDRSRSGGRGGRASSPRQASRHW